MRNKYLLLMLFLSIVCFKGFSQAPGCPDVSVFAPAPLCHPGECTELTADFFDTGATTSYGVSSIPYAPPYPFIGGTQVSVNIDDKWSPLVTLPFSFCFYGQNYTQALIGSNGVITFDTTNFAANGTCPWSYSQSVPDTGFPIKNAIYGVYQDIDPSIDNSFANPNINYAILGSAPCRTLVVNFSEVAQFGCTTDATVGAQTSQIVLYETTNVIEVYVQRRVPCTSWNGGRGVIGVQNAGGTEGVTPPGRNTGSWTTTNEAWRFTPDGTSTVVFEWLDSNGAVVSTDTTISVCPPETTTYTARATYTPCGNNAPVVKTQDVVVEIDELELGEPEDFVICAVNPPPYVFDLSQNSPLIRMGGNEFQYPVTYHLTQENADEGFEPIIPDNAFSTNTSVTIYARMENALTGCANTTTFEIIIAEAPVAGQPNDINLCDDDGDGFVLTDLTVQNSDVLAGLDENAYIIAYFESLSDASNNTNEIPTPENYNAEDGPIFVRISTLGDDSCFDTTSFDINITELPNDVVSPTPMEICDDNANDGTASFDLTDAVNEIIAAEPGMTLDITVHETQAEADAGTNPQNYPAYVSDSQAINQTIYFRVKEAGSSLAGCYVVVPMDLTVNQSPAPPAPLVDYVLCDQTDYMTPDQTEEFDLTVKDLEVTGGNPDYAVSYYETPGDADQGTNPIVNLTAYANQSNPQTIYVRLENTVTTCYDVFDFDLVVTPLPVYDSAQTDFHECEEVPGQADFDLHSHDTDLASGVSTVNVSYYNSQIEAETGDPATQLPDVYVAPDMAQIWARLQSSVTGCWTAVQITLHVDPAPIAPALTALEECAFDNDPFENFDVQSVIDYIESQLTDVTVTAHETMDDAEFGTNAINPVDYTNIVANTQTLYIRVSSAFTVCYDIEELQLIVHQAPIATDPEDYALCDNGLDDTDGVGIFVLPSRESEILGGLDPSLYTVGYYPSYGDAELEQNPIPNPGSYSATTNSAVYVRVTDNATGCYDIVTLTLIVHPLPVATQPAPYTLCDVNTIGGQPDEVEEFDLTTRIPEIIGLQTGINVTFHHSLSDADANINAIQTPEAYTNQSNAEAIYVRVTFEATGCYRIVLLDIRVEPLPVVVPPSQEALTVCDPDSDGQAQFDLDALVADMINNGENLSVTFHETAIDAELGINAIPNTDNYTNTNAYNQTIYVRVENTVTGCYTATAYALNLIVVDTPQIDADLADITLCDTDNNDQDGVMAVDLTVQDAYILEHLGNADPSDYIIHYFNDPVDAQTGAPRITNPGAYAAQDGEVIYVRIEDVATGCYSIESFTVYVNIPLALTRPPVLSVCNEALPNDMTAEFDLTVMENTILGPFGVGLGYTVNYYEPGVTTPIADPTHYVNTSNPMTLTVEVITLAGCKSTTTMTIKVLPLPTPNTAPDALVLCDDNNAGDGQEEFDLTQAAGDIMDNEPNLILSYHLTYEDADQDVNAIADPAHFVSGTATIYVRVEANTGNPNDAVCYQIVELELIVNPLPALGENGTIPAYAICEQNTDGFATFILSSHIPEILGEDADPNDYLVRFYFDQAALDAGTALPNQYNNISTPQDILVWVQHIESGCTITAPMQLLVEEAAVANAPADPVLSTCDDDGDNDGMHVFDLSVFDAEILGTQDPADYSVAYYETLEDAEDATNPIADPAVYVNTTADVMTIYARVTNTSTISGCHDITEITLIVERLPEPVITSVDGSDTICVDYTTNDVLRTVTLDSGIPSDMGYSFVWYLDGVELTDYDPASPTYEASAEGNYTVEVTGPAPLNCISDISAAFQVHQSGPASPVGPGYEVTNYFSDNQVITVFVEGYGEYEYKLDEDGMWQSSNVFTDVPAGTHTVYVRDVSTEFACDEIAIEGVSLVDYPHYFTPNGDGYHDTWNIIGLNQPDAKVYIFDRYGKLIKQISATEESEGWDGTFNGTPLPATDYWFTVTYRETVNGQPVVKEFKAHFSLKR